MGCLWWRSCALLALRSPEVHKHLCSRLHLRYCTALSPRESQTPSKVAWREQSQWSSSWNPCPSGLDAFRCCAWPGITEPLPTSLASSSPFFSFSLCSHTGPLHPCWTRCGSPPAVWASPVCLLEMKDPCFCARPWKWNLPFYKIPRGFLWEAEL